MRKNLGLARLLSVATLSAVVAVGSLAAVASAASANNPKAHIQQGNSACGADLSTLPVIGFANYHRNGDTVSVQFHLKHALPNHSYYIQLWGGACSFLGPVIPTQTYTIGKLVTTNKKGVANANIRVHVSSSLTRFFATAQDGTTFVWSDTPAVTLQP